MKHKIAVIFDMDGVIVDSVGYNWRQNNTILSNYGIKITDEKLFKYIGRNLQDQIEAINRDYKVRINYKSFSESLSDLKKQQKRLPEPMSGAVKLIEYINKIGIDMAIGTSNSRQNVDALLKKMGLESIFKVIVSKEDVINHKPDPEVYVKCAMLLGCDRTNCIVIEDSPSGISAAKSAGIACIAVKNKYCRLSDLSGANIVVDSLEDQKIMKFINSYRNLKK